MKYEEFLVMLLDVIRFRMQETGFLVPELFSGASVWGSELNDEFGKFPGHQHLMKHTSGAT